MADEISNLQIAEKAHRQYPRTALQYEDGDILYLKQGETLMADLPSGYRFRSASNLFAYVEQGSAAATFNGRQTVAGTLCGVVCPAGTLVDGLTLAPGTELHLLCISNQLLFTMLHDKLDAWYRAVYLCHINTLDFSDDASRQATAFYKDLLHFRAQHLEYNYSREVVKLLLQTIVTDICSMLTMQTADDMPPRTPSAERLFAQFVALLSATEVKHRPVQHYADQLCISAKHLAKVCRQQSGHTAAEWITRAVKEDIRHALGNPALSHKEVADLLGFGSVSFFGRYVREQFGCTPAQLRNLNS